MTLIAVENGDSFLDETLGRLGDSGVNIIFAANGLEAIRKTADKGPVTIFLSYPMIGMDCFQVINAMKNINPSAKVIVFTEKLSPKQKRSFTAHGADRVIEKQTGIKKLMSSLRDLGLEPVRELELLKVC